MEKQITLGYQTAKKERVAYWLFFLGQNILWGYAGYVETFLTDIGIAAAAAAVILLLPKLWDAVNDVLFGYIVDIDTFKNRYNHGCDVCDSGESCATGKNRLVFSGIRAI